MHSHNKIQIQNVGIMLRTGVILSSCHGVVLVYLQRLCQEHGSRNIQQLDYRYIMNRKRVEMKLSCPNLVYYHVT